MKNAIWLQAVLTRMCLLTAMLALGGAVFRRLEPSVLKEL